MLNGLIVGLGMGTVCLLFAVLQIWLARRLDQPLVVDAQLGGYLIPALLVLSATGFVIALVSLAGLVIDRI